LARLGRVDSLDLVLLMKDLRSAIREGAMKRQT